MGYKTTADLLEAQNLFGVEKPQIRQDNAIENLSYFFTGSKNRATPPQGMPSSPNAQGVADASRMNQTNQFEMSNRPANFDTTKARMALPLGDVAKSGSESFGVSTRQSTQVQNQEPDMATQYRSLSSADLDRVKGLDNQELQANINRVKQYQPLANNEANRAYGMKLDNDNRAYGNQLATQFPYKKYETESSSAREIMNNAQSAIPTFLNRATASRINPVSLSL